MQEPTPDTNHYPVDIAMPDGSGPESIVIGEGPWAYVSSLQTGVVFRVDLEHGTHEVFAPAVGPNAVGMALDWRGRLFVCGGIDGSLTVIDTADRSVAARYRLGKDHSFTNEVLVTPDAAFVTDSFDPVLYKLPFGEHGSLPTQDGIVRIPLSGDLVYQRGDTFAECFNANGIARTPDARAVLVVQTNTGRLFRVDTATGHATQVDLGGADVLWGDGMLLEDHTLHVVQNLANTVSVIELNGKGTSGAIVERWSDPRFETPTCMARFGNRFYLSNARFTIPEPKRAQFRLIAVSR